METKDFSQESVLSSRLEGIPTRWSLVQMAHAGGKPESATAARQALVLRYAPSIRRYLGGILRGSDEDADELAQEVVVRLMRGDFAGADPGRGRFRDLLRTATRNMVRNHWAKAGVRRTAELDPESLGGSEKEDPRWQGEWQRNILDQAYAALSREQAEGPARHHAALLRLRAENPDDSSQELAAKLLQKTGFEAKPDHLRQLLRRARLRFAECLVTEVALGLGDPSPERVEEELADLGLLDHVREFLPEDWARTGILR